MAIKTQEVTLRIVYDDAEFQEAPAKWAWSSALTVGGANANAGSFVVADVRAAPVENASSAEISDFKDE